MARNVRLKAPSGSDEANWGPSRFRVDNAGEVEVPEEAVAPLLERGGFVLANPPKVEVPHGHARVHLPGDAHASCSFGGQSFAPDAHGVLTVPVAAVAALEAHGFVLLTDDENAAEDAAEAAAKVAAEKAAAEAKAKAEAEAKAAADKAAAEAAKAAPAPEAAPAPPAKG